MSKKEIEQIITDYLNGTISDADSKDLLAWIELSEANRKLFLEYYNLWELTYSGLFDAEKAFKRFTANKDNIPVEATTKKKRIDTLYKYIAVAAASVAALIFVLSYDWNKQNDDDIINFAHSSSNIDFSSSKTRLILSDKKIVELQQKEALIKYDSTKIEIDEKNTISKQESSAYNQLITPYGKRSTIIFSDGSKAWVNSGTRLIYPAEFKKDEREIYVDGEIYIEVAKDKERPFIVKSNSLNIKVLGTKFNLSAYSSDIQQRVVLVSGSVEVLPRNNDTKEATLVPRQMYTVSGNKAQIEYTDTSKHISWIDGFYYFDSMKLGDILNRLSRYYQKDILFDKNIAEFKCSGKLDMQDDLGDVLNGLTHTVPIKCIENPDGTYTIELSK